MEKRSLLLLVMSVWRKREREREKRETRSGWERGGVEREEELVRHNDVRAASDLIGGNWLSAKAANFSFVFGRPSPFSLLVDVLVVGRTSCFFCLK